MKGCWGQSGPSGSPSVWPAGGHRRAVSFPLVTACTLHFLPSSPFFLNITWWSGLLRILAAAPWFPPLGAALSPLDRCFLFTGGSSFPPYLRCIDSREKKVNDSMCLCYFMLFLNKRRWILPKLAPWRLLPSRNLHLPSRNRRKHQNPPSGLWLSSRLK